MGPKKVWHLVGVILMVGACAECRQVPDEPELDLEAANGGDIQLDPDPEIQTLKHLKTLAEKKRLEQILKKPRMSNKGSREKNQKLQDMIAAKMEKTMKNMEANPKYARLQRQREEENRQLGKHAKQKSRNGKRSIRSADQQVPEDLNINPHSDAHKRTKRFARITSLWPSGVVPYHLDDGYYNTSNAEEKNILEMAMQFYNDMSAVLFTPNNSALALSLPHNYTLHFISTQPWTCWSYIGNQQVTDQYISVFKCGLIPAIHELGHAIGLEHEHQHPDRGEKETVFWHNIISNRPDILVNYYVRSLSDGSGNVIRSTFGRQTDAYSFMHYSLNIQDSGWTANYQPQLGVYDPDTADTLRWSSFSLYPHYALKDINAYYKPEADPCASDGLTCYNDGFVTKLRKLECKCICVQGLGSESGCTELEQDDVALKTSNWPTDVALLKPLAGCPAGFHGDASIRVKSATYSTPTDWIGQMATYVNGLWELQLEFCVQDGEERQNIQNLGAGDYCYWKSGSSCLEGFSEGTVSYHDISQSASYYGSHFPSGDYTSSETIVMNFCCRRDGHIDTPMKAPSNFPFVLTPFTLKGCQAIKGMTAEMTSVTFDNTVDGYGPTGSHPYIYKFSNTAIFNLYVCYYKPVSYNGYGGIFYLNSSNPTVHIHSPNYPSNYTPNTRITWIVHSPANTRIVLHFDDFYIPAGPDGQARDLVEIRNNHKGTPGHLYYGDNMQRSWVSYYNYTAVYLFSDGPETARGFNGTFMLVTEDDYAYSLKGENYDGPRNYTRTFESCIPWSEVREANCTQDPYSENDRFDILEGNYCRNPGGIVDFPFCYTHAKDGYCRVELCDVSNLESCYDVWQDCSASVCDTTDAPKCANTCGICTARVGEVQNFPKACAPPPASFGPHIPVKSSYPMGDNVTLTCNTTGEQVNLTCSTMGSWLPRLQNLCGTGFGCAADQFEYQTEDGLKCLKVLTDTLVTYEQALVNCSQIGGQLVTEKGTSQSLDQLDVISSSHWLGLSDSVIEGTFLWVDGSSLNREDKWAPGEPYSYTAKWSASNTHYGTPTWNKTETGEDCIPWSGTYYDQDQYFPGDGSVANAGNNCRDPSKSGRHWCYTSDSWGWCDLAFVTTPACNLTISEKEALFYGTLYSHYHGTVNSVNGINCWTWANGYPDSYFTENNETAAEAGNNCRVFAWYGYTVPWCWVYDNGWKTMNCDVPEYCGGHGYRKTNEYTGTVDVTTYGYRCLRWDYLATLEGFEWLQTNFHDYFPDANISAAENYCRGGPWGPYTKPACYYVNSAGDLNSWYCPVTEEEEMQDCVYRDPTTGEWKDVYCDEMHTAVCQLEPVSVSSECSDQNANCAPHFETSPAVFVDNPVWAESRCALTSGACSPNNASQPNTVTCSNPYSDPASLNLDVVRLNQPIGVVDYIEHRCKSLYTLVSGNLKRGCTADGTWTGSTPNCTLKSLVGGWNNDNSIRERHLLDKRNTIYLANNKNHRIEHDGNVTGWRLYNMAPGDFELLVFRQNGQIRNYTVIGKTTVAPISDSRAVTISLSPEDSFSVQSGDVIGWRFSADSDGGIPHDRCKLEYTEGGNWYKLAYTGTIAVNNNFYFEEVTDECRISSFAVNVAPAAP